MIDIATVLDPVLRDNGGPTLTHALVPGSPGDRCRLQSFESLFRPARAGL